MTIGGPSQLQAAPTQHQGREWIEQIRGGDAAAFEALFRAFAPGLCVFLTRYVGSPAVAEDLVQDLFLTLWKKRAELHVDGTVSAYLFTAAKNRALNHLQHERVDERFRAALLSRSDDSTASGEAELLEILVLQEAMERLPARCRLIFLLSRERGMTYDEIAKSLGLSIKTVETQMGRALRSLRAQL